MCGDLKDAVRRCVDDRLACFHVLRAQAGKDLGARRCAVAQCAPPDFALEALHKVRGEAVRVGGEWLSRNDAHQLPVPGDAVFTLRGFRHPAPAAARLCGRDAENGRDIAQTQPLQTGRLKPPTAAATWGSVALCVSAAP